MNARPQPAEAEQNEDRRSELLRSILESYDHRKAFQARESTSQGDRTPSSINRFSGRMINISDPLYGLLEVVIMFLGSRLSFG